MTLLYRLFARLALVSIAFAPLAAFAGPDEDAIAKQLESFRAAQVALNSAALTALSAPELSYSHSDGRVEDRSAFVANATSGRAKFLALDYRNPSIKVLGTTAIVRFNWVGEQQTIATGAVASTNLHILMAWQKQGEEWKLIARSATKL